MYIRVINTRRTDLTRWTNRNHTKKKHDQKGGTNNKHTHKSNKREKVHKKKFYSFSIFSFFSDAAFLTLSSLSLFINNNNTRNTTTSLKARFESTGTHTLQL